MTNSKSTKRALVSSALAVFLCVAMLIGTTFAWFTDTASASVNKIQAGTLDVGLEMYENDEWVNAEGETLSFTDNYWEPGCTYELPQLRIVNKGNLALKYKVVITGIQGDAKLNEVINWNIGGAALGAEQSLAAGAETLPFTIKGTMRTNAGNAYQGLSIDGISITVYAKQDTVESDSNNNLYDAGAAYSTANAERTKKLISGGSLTINETLSIDSDVTGGDSDVIRVTGGNHVITGGVYSASGAANNSALRVDGGNVTIKGGEFTVEGDNNAIYAAGGSITIEGGIFKSTEAYHGTFFTLNCLDNSGSVITVKGGAFYKFDPSNCNVAPAGMTEVVVADGYEVVNNGDWYYVVPENAAQASNAADLATAIANGGNIVLNSNITASDVMNITENVTIYGNGNTITAASGKDRVFNVQGTSSDISIKLANLTLKNSNGLAYDRCISFGGDTAYGNSGQIRLEMDNCDLTTQHYALNVASNNADIEIIVKNSKLTGYAAAQTWSENSKLTFENCTLTGVNRWNGSDNDFSTVNVNGPATGSVVTLNNCTIKNTTTGTAKQTFFGISANATVTATGCTYDNNGTAVAADTVKADYVYIGTDDAYTLTIN